AGDWQAREAHQAFGRTSADLHGDGVRLEVAGLRLFGERAREAGMPIAKSGDCMAAIEIEHALAATVGEPDTLSGHHFKRILCKNRGKKVSAGRCRPYCR